MRKTAADPLVREADDITYLILREGSKVPEVCDKKSKSGFLTLDTPA